MLCKVSLGSRGEKEGIQEKWVEDLRDAWEVSDGKGVLEREGGSGWGSKKGDKTMGGDCRSEAPFLARLIPNFCCFIRVKPTSARTVWPAVSQKCPCPSPLVTAAGDYHASRRTLIGRARILCPLYSSTTQPKTGTCVTLTFWPAATVPSAMTR